LHKDNFITEYDRIKKWGHFCMYMQCFGNFKVIMIAIKQHCPISRKSKALISKGAQIWVAGGY
jgi:hypothetical protein